MLSFLTVRKFLLETEKNMDRTYSVCDLDDQLPTCELPEELRLIEVEIGRDIVENTHMGHPASREQMDQDEWDDASLVENVDRFLFF